MEERRRDIRNTVKPNPADSVDYKGALGAGRRVVDAAYYAHVLIGGVLHRLGDSRSSTRSKAEG